jgi:hypothetical protein
MEIANIVEAVPLLVGVKLDLKQVSLAIWWKYNPEVSFSLT